MKKNFTKALLLVLVMAVSIVFTSCGAPANLEEYINSDEEAMAALESMESEGLTIEVKENTMIYTYTYSETLDADMIEAMKPEFESTMESTASTFTNLADTLEEETGLEEITVKVVYNNGDGSEIFAKEYK